MRPEILFPLFSPVTTLPGVGPRIAKSIESLAGPHVVDLLWHLPANVIDRRYSPELRDAAPGRIATLKVQVDSHAPPPTRRLPYKVHCSDGTGTIDLVFFHAKGDYLQKQLPQGEWRVISGKVDEFNGVLQMAHPDHMAPLEEFESLRTVEPVYPLTAGLNLKPLSKAVKASLELAPDLPEWLDPSLKSKHGWRDWRTALAAVHAPASPSDIALVTPDRKRLAYDELLASQLAMALVRARQSKSPGRVLKGDGRLRRIVLDALPYAPTNAQTVAVQDVDADLASDQRMLRLLQGDVGSGKTLVALMSLLAAAEAGAQSALMAPTEILARQHFENLAPLCAEAGLTAVLLTGRDKGKARSAVLEQIAGGDAHIVIGTHALFQQSVEFADLALVVIDEQHRFGVHQRLMLAAKGDRAKGAINVLVMTATPIPRTLTLTLYGDMEVSRLTEKPPGRQPIETRAIPAERLSDVVDGLGRAMQAGSRAYWVCPLVSESELVDLAAAEERHAMLEKLYPGKVGLVHGRMTGAEKDAVMTAFATGALSVLVATTVIEVGVDVPEATIMVVEHAERFGLSQLHQLRGRVGRGSGRSNCVLIYAAPLGQTARARLDIMRETEDGFLIAEEDLRLRGTGELLGTRQSGMPDMRLADLSVHVDLLETARDDVKLILRNDPELNSPRGEALRVLLYLFERDAAVKYWQSG